MTPYAHPGLDIAQHPQTIPITGPESPSASTIMSPDTIITAPSDLSSEIIGESFSSRSLGLPVESTDTSIPRSTQYGPFTPHKLFFFEDGNITFLVDDTLYRVHRYFFCRDSKIFKTRLSRLLAQEGSSPSLVISIENVKSKDFDAFLSVLYPRDFNSLESYSYEELSSILDLSTRWGFTTIRDMAIRCLKPPTPHQRLILGREYGIDQWVLPALQELCERPRPLTRDEARLMDLDDIVLVGSVREKVRTHAITANPTGIMDCIKAWGSGEPREPPAGVTTAMRTRRRPFAQPGTAAGMSPPIPPTTTTTPSFTGYLPPVPDCPATPGDEWPSRPQTPRGGWPRPVTPGVEWISRPPTPRGGWPRPLTPGDEWISRPPTPRGGWA